MGIDEPNRKALVEVVGSVFAFDAQGNLAVPTVGRPFGPCQSPVVDSTDAGPCNARAALDQLRR